MYAPRGFLFLTLLAATTTVCDVGLAQVGEKDSPQLQGSSHRNSVSDQANVPAEWDLSSGENVLWYADLGSETYGNPVIANGKLFIATNNGAAYLDRFPETVDLGVLLCFDAKSGKFLWQHSSQKLAAGRYADWPDQGVCCSAYADGDRIWFVNNRCEVICADSDGFHDGTNDGVKTEESDSKDEADVIWSFDMRNTLGVKQLYMATCSITGVDNLIFVSTSNGVDEAGEVMAPDAPSLICMDRDTGKVLWTDNSPKGNILHGQWSSPAFAEIGGTKQVIFGAGDGYVYSFDAAGENGKAKLLWKFDCNPKESYYQHGGSGTRAYIIGTPVIYDNKVFVGIGEDPEYGDANGHLWCIDATKRGDVSPTLVTNAASRSAESIRMQAFDPDAGDKESPNPNSAEVWHYVGEDPSEFETTMHRTIGSVAIKDGLLFVSDFSGLFHCLDVKTGKAHWTEDMFSGSWGSPTIAQDRVYIANSDGDILIFKLSKEKDLMDTMSIEMGTCTSPVVANNRLYMAGRSRIFAFEEGAKTEVED